MKMLHVSGDDYSALTFEEWIEGKSLVEFITKLESGKKLPKDLSDIEFKVYEFGEIDPKFIAYVRSQQDYDMAKTTNFYFVE